MDCIAVDYISKLPILLPPMTTAEVTDAYLKAHALPIEVPIITAEVTNANFKRHALLSANRNSHHHCRSGSVVLIHMQSSPPSVVLVIRRAKRSVRAII